MSFIAKMMKGAYARQKCISIKYVYILVPGTCEQITLRGQRDFVDVMKVQTLRWRDYPDFGGGSY